MSVREPQFSFSCACVLAQSNVQDFDIFNIFKLEDLCKINYKLRGLMQLSPSLSLMKLFRLYQEESSNWVYFLQEKYKYPSEVYFANLFCQVNLLIHANWRIH